MSFKAFPAQTILECCDSVKNGVWVVSCYFWCLFLSSTHCPLEQLPPKQAGVFQGWLGSVWPILGGGNLQHCHSLPAPGHFYHTAEGWGSCQRAGRAPFVRKAQEGHSRGYLNINQHNNHPVFPVPTAMLGLHLRVGGLQSPELLPALGTWPGTVLWR